MGARMCPNRCGTTPPVGMYACRACWRILPPSLRTAILTTWKAGNWTEHAKAKAAAQAWFDTRSGAGYCTGRSAIYG